jgi:two-component system OmpR family response regulator
MMNALAPYPIRPTFALRRERRIAPKRILHVDDEAAIRELVELSLGLEPDFVTWGCGSGEEALAVAAVWRPDLVLLDLIMPQMGGVGTLARLRIDIKSKMPVVFMTALRTAQDPEYFRPLGAVGVIVKPFEWATLAVSVRKFLHH